MADLFRFADDLGPAKILHVYDPGTAMKGIVVVDNVACGPAIGGIITGGATILVGGGGTSIFFGGGGGSSGFFTSSSMSIVVTFWITFFAAEKARPVTRA